VRSRDDVNTQVRTLMSLKLPSSMIFLVAAGGREGVNLLSTPTHFVLSEDTTLRTPKYDITLLTRTHPVWPFSIMPLLFLRFATLQIKYMLPISIYLDTDCCSCYSSYCLLYCYCPHSLKLEQQHHDHDPLILIIVTVANRQHGDRSSS
jgi:hypothetical protein